MLRQALLDRAQRGDRLFRWRGGEISRVEGLTDGVFALAMTLLIVPFEVQGAESFEQFEAILLRAPVMAVCIAFLVMVWQSHFVFHRRYGLEDGVTVWLNGGFLLVLMLGVYPLKLLSTLLVNSFTSLGDGLTMADLGREQVTWLMQVYGLGFGLMYVALFAMVLRAWRRREVLELDAAERCLTLGLLAGHGVMIGTAILSVSLASVGMPSLAGLAFFLIGPLQGLVGWRFGARAEALVADRPSEAETIA